MRLMILMQLETGPDGDDCNATVGGEDDSGRVRAGKYGVWGLGFVVWGLGLRNKVGRLGA